MKMNKQNQKNIVVVGTSRGIGFQLVKLLAKQNHRIIALSRNHQPVEDLKLTNVTSLACDIAQEKSINSATDFIEKQFESVDILINNAGCFLKSDFENVDRKALREVYEVNVFGVFELTQKLIPMMKNKSHVVTISSMGGVQGSVKFPGLSAYSSSKAAVINLTELLAEEFKETKISFNVLALGAVQTEMLAEAFPGFQAPVTAEEMATYIADFSLNGDRFYNGKLLQVSNSTP
ncbi:MAG: SDR family NAD(P)-dependent oxidoreductase [Bacteroidota bacterium]